MFRSVLFVICWLTASAQTTALPFASVCDLLAGDFTKLNTKVVRVRGLLGGSDEGTWLSSECKTHPVTKGLSWGNNLSVYVDMTDDRTARSWNAMNQKLKSLHADLVQDRVRVTVVGRLETRESLDALVVDMPNGLRRAGFGHLGAAPAEINIITVEDIVVEPRSPSVKHRGVVQ
jgi:hypothetical protein